ncbi:uncharacterized protein LOC106174263 [Lingula anatina]|uniref:Uncharacterized protein LOC106174263 n=1 Tax=Lingula anatina TaxID=7574 RepID=A0A1S3JM46_LINAN|nr:uncharacterized protein LOC106174263 [Lingula anatina]|eukprot:XP_013411196.1 uncharacterized protein LOC106174263 [Lingula anatina]
MYCPYCGKELPCGFENFLCCTFCGKSLPDWSSRQIENSNRDVASAAIAGVSGLSSSSSAGFLEPKKEDLPQLLQTFKKMREKRNTERNSFFTNKKSRFSMKDNEVNIRVGILIPKNGCLKPFRGKTLKVTVRPSWTAEETLQACLAKHRAHNGHEMEEGGYCLTYDSGKVVEHLPEGNPPAKFTIRGYKEQIQKDWQRLVLYICAREHLEKEEAHVEILTSDEESDLEEWIHTKEVGCRVDAGTPTVSFRVDASSTRTEQSSYETYVEALQDDPDDYPEEVWSTNVETQDTNASPEQEMDLTALVIAWQEQNAKTEDEELIVRRRKLLNSVLSATKREGFSFFKIPKVEFSGEKALDDGGPRRECFRLLMKEISSLDIFEGPPEALVFRHNVTKLEAGSHHKSGQLVAWSILHGGPGFPMLHPLLFEKMVGREPKREDIPKYIGLLLPEEKDKLNKIYCSDKTEFDAVVAAEMDWICDQGIFKFSFEEKETMIFQLLLNIVYYKSKTEADEFLGGLNSIGQLGVLMHKYPSSLQRLFVHSTSAVTRMWFKDNMSYVHSDNSAVKDVEEDTVLLWERFLQDCESGRSQVTLHKVLGFITGAEEIPPGGFEKKLEVGFFIPSERCRFPWASTCGLYLHLPTGDDLGDLLVTAIQEGMGFSIS